MDNSTEIRTVRLAHLVTSDYTQASDVDFPLSASDKALWADYRQVLRDVTLQSSFPESVTWPARPQEPSA